MQENASLRAQVSQAESGREDVEKQLIETQSRFNEVSCHIDIYRFLLSTCFNSLTQLHMLWHSGEYVLIKNPLPCIYSVHRFAFD